MRRNVLIIGAVVFIVGLILFVTGDFVLAGHASSKFYPVGANEFRSNELNLTSSNLLTVTSKISGVWLLHASQLTSVNASNIANYAITPFVNITEAGVHAEEYKNIQGSFFVVYFNSAAANSSSGLITYSVYSSASDLELTAIATAVGLLMIIAGIIVAIVGAVLKRKPLS